MKEAAFRRTLGMALGTLIVQFLLGTTVNLFVKFPPTIRGRIPRSTSAEWSRASAGRSCTAAYG